MGATKKNNRHTELVNACSQLLDMRGVVHQINNSGAIPVLGRDGARRFIRFGKKGSSDIVGCLRNGLYLAVECKTGSGRTTPEQDDFLESIRANKGVATVVRSVEELDELITANLWRSS